MIPYNDELNKQIINLIEASVGVPIEIFNLSVVTNPPFASRRIEFRLGNFVSTGQIYRTANKDGADYITKSLSEYRCQLIIRVFDKPKEVEVLTSRITGAIQTFEFLDSYLNLISLKNESMRIRPFLVERDNIVVSFREIVIDANIGLEFEGAIPFFDKIDDITYNIKQ